MRNLVMEMKALLKFAEAVTVTHWDKLTPLPNI